MKHQMILCLDTESLKMPEAIGLPDENLSAQSWLSVYTDAFTARNALKNVRDERGVWVVSSDSMEGINLAAAIKADNGHREVSLVTFETSGSVMSRCNAAGVQVIRGKDEFVKSYTAMKAAHRNGVQDGAESIGVEPFTKRGSAVLNGEGNGAAISDPEAVVDHAAIGGSGDGAHTLRGEPISSLSIEEPRLNLAHVIGEPNERHAGHTIAIVSGSGGVGKSTIAVCMALTYQEMGFRTLIFDADLQFGDMAYILGCDNALMVSDLIEEPERIARLAPENGLPALIAAPDRLEHSEILMAHMEEIIEFVKGYFDIVVINTGSFWTEQHAQIIETVDRPLFLLDQRPTSIHACSRAIALCSRCGIAIQPFMYALNYCSRHALLTPLDVSCAMQGISVQEIKDGGKEVSELLGASLSKELLATNSAFIRSVRELCVGLLPEEMRALVQTKIEPEKNQRKGHPFSGFRRRRVACL